MNNRAKPMKGQQRAGVVSMQRSIVTVRLGISVAILVLLTLLTFLTGCERPSRSLRLYMPLHQQFDPESIQDIFAEQSKLRMDPAPTALGLSGLDALSGNQADLTLLENSTPFVSGIRAVLPIYEGVLHVLVRQDLIVQNPEQPLRDVSFFVTDQSVAGNTFVELITRRQGLTPGEYVKSSTLEPGVTDIIIYFGPIDAHNTGWYRPGYELVSPGQRFSPRGMFFEERVGYVAPKMKSKIIPALTYDLPGNSEPLLTVAVDTLLVTRKDTPAAVVYELTETLLEQKPRFTAIAPQLFSGINESFDPLDLNFPLHEGARRYLERDEPGLLERYAESINMLVYVTFLAMTGFLGLARWRAQRKKDRIDVFYEKVLAIRARRDDETTAALLEELESLEREAFSSLIKERLAANESFRIFTDLLARVRTDLQSGGKQG